MREILAGTNSVRIKFCIQPIHLFILFVCLAGVTIIPRSSHAVDVTYQWQRDSGTLVAGVTTNWSSACGTTARPGLTTFEITLMSTAAFNCADAKIEMPGSSNYRNVIQLLSDTAYTENKQVSNIDMDWWLQSTLGSVTINLRFTVGYMQGGVFTPWGYVDHSSVQGVGGALETIDFGALTALAPSGSHLAVQITKNSGNWGEIWMGTDHSNSGTIRVTEVTYDPPIVTAFDVPATSTSLDVPVTTFTAADNPVPTGYMVTESATAPGTGDAAWTGTPPASYTAGGQGNRILYAWAKDGVNVSLSASDTVYVDSLTPTFASLSGAADAGTSKQVTLTWSVATDASLPITYNIYWAITSTGQNFTTPNATSSSGTGDTVSGLTDGQIYYFVVRAEDNLGNEETNLVEYSATPTDSTTPVFSGLTGATDAAINGMVNLIWNAATDANAPITYNIYWATTSGGQNFGIPDATSSSSNGETASGLTNGQIYYFVVRAKDPAANEETNVIEFSATPTEDLIPPAAITDLAVASSASTIGSHVRLLTWTAPGDDGNTGTATTYTVKYAKSEILLPADWAAATPVAYPPSPSVAGTSESLYVWGLESNTTYYFAIKAKDDDKESALSNSPSGKTGLLKEWNMVSVPKLPVPDDAATVFGNNAGNGPMYHWTPTGNLIPAPADPWDDGFWTTAATVVPGQGIFLNSRVSNTPTQAAGTANTAPTTTLTLSPGYNLIGNPYESTVNLSDCSITNGTTETFADAIINGWVDNVIFIWDGSTYISTAWDSAILEPWKAYWLLVPDPMAVDIDLIIPKP